jgi:cell division protein FtsI/penicillin-binding protein 2
MNARLRLRTRIVLISVILFAIGLIINLYWLQVVNGADYAKKAELQYIRPATSLLNRGSIFLNTKDGTNIQGATLKSGYKIYINPSILTESKTVYQAISEYVDIDKDDFDKKTSKVNDKYEELADKVPEKEALSIKGLKIPGLGITKEIWRVYPGETMLAHELGILGESASSSLVVGRYGLERSYENILSRSESASEGNVFAELFGDSKTKDSNNISKKEGDIVTTIEPTVQKYLEKVLEQIQNKWRPDTVGGIVIDPNTGEIVAMSSLPTFNPNDTSGVKDARIFSNPLVESAYEMGSIIKPLTMATALDFGAITPSYTYDDTGTMILNGKKISNHDNLIRGMTTMQDLLGQSLNIGAAKIA